MTTENNTPSKRCPQCGESYPLTSKFFYRDKTHDNGFQSMCKACKKNKHKSRYAANPAYMREKAKQWVKEHRRQHNANNQKWIKDHPEYRRKKDRDWRQRNIELARQQDRDWQKNNRDKDAVKSRRRRALKANAPGSHTATDIDCLYINQRGLCAYCSTPLHGNYHVDHVIPLSRGGSNNPDNLVLACATCNTSKGDKLISEWVR